MENPGAPQTHAFTETDRTAVYPVIFSHRKVRAQFLPDPVPDAALRRVLLAAHHTPAMSFIRTLNFVVMRSPEAGQRVHDAFCATNPEAAHMFPDEKRATHGRLKLQYIPESPINLCASPVTARAAERSFSVARTC